MVKRKILVVVFASSLFCYLALNLLSSSSQNRSTFAKSDKHEESVVSPATSRNHKISSDYYSVPDLITLTTSKKLIAKLCQDPPPDLLGSLNFTLEDVPSFEEIERNNPNLKPGGSYKPSDCLSIHEKVAIIVPYRNRDIHLRAFLNHMHPILQRQQLNYQIFVVEQAGNGTFNKALLMNAAYQESLKISDEQDAGNRFQCLIFHDVDLLSEDDRGIYACRDRPIHFSEYLAHLNYEPYHYVDVLFGGAVALPRRFFELVNGYSNGYFGWGAEDEDMRQRLSFARIPIIKADKEHYRYRMFSHTQDAGNPRNEQRVELLSKAIQRMHHDGLNSLKYKLISSKHFHLYTHFLIEFNRTDYQ